MYDANADKVFRWYAAGSWWGYKVGVTAYSNGLVIAHNPLGLTSDKMQVTELKTKQEAVAFAERVKQAFEVLRSHLEQASTWKDSIAVRQLIGKNNE